MGAAQTAATTDPLTHRANRDGLAVQVLRVVADAAEHDEEVSVALLDVDHCKRVNDQHGHATDAAVYVAKSSGRNRVQHSSPRCAATDPSDPSDPVLELDSSR